jgi:hypothetical protein
VKSVILHSVLAAIGLLAAYQTWARGTPEQVQPGEVTIAECEITSFQSLSLKSKNRTVSIEPKGSAGDTFYWINITNTPPQMPDKNGATKATEKQGSKKSVAFVANAELEAALRALAPLKALRELGKTSEAQRKAFGLDTPDTELNLGCGGRTHVLLVGGSTYGEGDRYARKPGSDRVFLFKGSIINDLNGAQNSFMQRELHGFELDKVDAVKVQARGASKRLLQRSRGGESAMWVDSSKPEQRNKLYGNWLSQLSHIGANAYLPPGKEPGTDLTPDKASDKPSTDAVSGGASPSGSAGQMGELEPVVSVEYEAEGKPLGKVDLVRVQFDGKTHYYAKSEKTRGWVTVMPSLAEQVAQDVGLVLGTEPAPASKTTAVSQKTATKPKKGDEK